MMNLWKHRNQILPIAGFLPATILAACIASSLHGYSAPELLMKTPADISGRRSDTDAAKTNKTESKNQTDTKSKKESAPAVTPVSETGGYQDGTYTGTGTGFAGPITVQVTIQGGKITDIQVLNTSDDHPYFDNAKALLKAIIAAQSTNVDTVSGATYSSVGLISAVRDALQKAGGSSANDSALPTLAAAGSGSSSSSGAAPTVQTVSEPAAYRDGVYTGSGTGFSGTITVQVTVSGGKITDIQVLSASDDHPYFDNATALLKTIIAAQSTNVDAVSGATYSSAGIIEAVRNALQQAAVSPAVTKSPEPQQGNSKETTTAPAAKPDKTGNFPYPDGTYEGIGIGYRGETSVSLTLKNGTIEKIEIKKTEDDASFFNRAKSLINTVVRLQSTEVDAVSGATFSSEGILEAITNALEAAKAAGEKEPAVTTVVTTASPTPTTITPGSSTSTETTTETVSSKYENGSYIGVADCYPDEDEDFDPYQLSLCVKIENDTILEISSIEGSGDNYDKLNNTYISRAAKGTSKKPGTVTQILSKQSTEGIDVISGATCSSDAILAAVENALEQARKGA